MLGPTFQNMDSPGSRKLSHTLSWGLSLAAFTSMLTFVAVKTPGKRGHLPPLRRWGPFLGLLVGVLLAMFDLTRHIFLDAGLFISTLHMFNPDGSLTPAGRFGQLGAWIGNITLFACLVWFVLPTGRAGPESMDGALEGNDGF
mmetsp:Transcript_40584/g.128945  ORF Transcript_40584/g.128945 Transcript_40584/m.128945 type:complete len:143 (-) Transcript_40584:62-490(-)